MLTRDRLATTAAAAPAAAWADATACGSDFAQDLLEAFLVRPHRMAPKHFYDEAGSKLFERICELPEYYPTRTELALLGRHAPVIARLAGPGCEIVEFGAGSLRKVRCLLDALEQPAGFTPIDISGEHLAASARELQRDYPGLAVVPVVGDYTAGLELPPAGPRRRIGFFPGSTIGNFTPEEALAFLRRAAGWLRGGALLLGADLVKAPEVLHAAYNDAQGVTAAFNRNLLVRANRELGADFRPERFAHYAFYNAPLQRIEMHLVSLERQTVGFCGHRFTWAEGESLHTENSYKFTLDGLQALARQAGFRPGPAWTDPAGLFSVHWLEAPPATADAASPGCAA